jgi:hypothetical protein
MHSLFLPSKSNAEPAAGAAAAVSAALVRIEPTPQEKWPLWVKTIAKFHRDGDTGIGDTIVHLIGDTNSARFKTWFQRKFGRSCGCTERQRWLNQKYPYAGSDSPILIPRDLNHSDRIRFKLDRHVRREWLS